MIAVGSFETNAGLDQDAALLFLQRIYPKFRKQYMWFKSTQWGAMEYYSDDESALGFRWRGKKGQHILTSGMDDYPRSPESNTGELHLDLLSWVGYYSKTLAVVAKYLQIDTDIKMFAEDGKQIMKTLDEIHWDSDSNSYTDVSIDFKSKIFGNLQMKLSIRYTRDTSVFYRWHWD